MDIHIVNLHDDRYLRTGKWEHHPDLPDGILGAVIVIPPGYTLEKMKHCFPDGTVDPLNLNETIGIRIKKKEPHNGL